MFITNYIIMLMHNNRPFTHFSDRKNQCVEDDQWWRGRWQL